MSNKIQSCLSSQVLEQIGRNEVSSDELLTIEEHVSECPHCREMFDSHYSSSQWSELIQPALSDSQLAVTTAADDGADHSSAILKLLGPTDDPNMLGRIGNYEIVGVIGQGGMGAVFKGFDRSLNRFVAIKMLLPHLAASGAARKRFAREGQAVAAVVDDHVMAIHCVDQWQGIPYLVMTYSRGVSLQKRLNDSGPLEVREILRIGMQAAKGLAAAHAQGIVHRDIKPSNILLDQNVERVQLVDFGLARAVDDASLTCSGTLAGTPQYMSPEQARAETVDHRSDLFSLGSVLYAMCVGHAPFRADSSYSVLRLIIEKEPRHIREINSDIPEWLCMIIGKLMAKHANDRFDSAKQVAELLEACLAHVQQPTTVPLPPSVARLSSIEIPSSPTKQAQPVPNVENKQKAWKRFVGPPIVKYIAAATTAAAFFLAGVVIVLELNKGTLTIKSVADNVPIRILQGKDTVQELTVSKQGTTTRLRAGTYTVEIEGDSTAYEIQGDNVTVKRGEVTLVDISVGQAKVVVTPSDNSTGINKPPVDISKAKTASTVVDVDLLLANLEFSNKRDFRGNNTDRSVRWARILMDLTNVGSTAVPKIIERLDQTEDDRMIASLAFVLRAIGDKRGVPALIRAIPKNLLPSQCNWLSRSPLTKGEMDSFFQKHRFKGQGDAVIGCSNSETELEMALDSLTDAKLPISHTFGSGTERQVYLQRQLLHKDAKRWADWWEQNSSRFVDDAAYANVKLSPFTLNQPDAVDPNEVLDQLKWQSTRELSALQKAGFASKGGYLSAFMDLDTGRSEGIPKSWRNKLLSDSERADLLVWAEKEGFDLFCEQIEEADHKTGHFVLRGLGLKAWQIDDKLWDAAFYEPTSWSEMAKNGRVVTGDRLVPFAKEKNALDPAAIGVFLFVTSEGTPGWIYVGPQLTDEPDQSGVISADWLHDNKSFVKGRRFGLHFFESYESQRVQGSLKHDDAGIVHWGKPDESGLQAGVRLSPSLKRYQVGQKVSIEILFRNILTQPIVAMVPDFPDYRLEVHDTTGAMVEVSDTQKLQSESGSRTENIGDQPIALDAKPLLLLDSSTSAEKRVQALSQADNPMLVHLSPGQSYRLQLKVRSLAVDASGIMKTGKVEFAVDAPVSQGASISFDQELGLVTVKGSKAEVQRTGAVLETMLKQLPNADTKSDASQTEAKELSGLKDQGDPQSQSHSDSPVAVVMVMHPAELQNGNTIQRAAATKTLSLLADNDFCGILSYGYLNEKSQTKSLWVDGSVLQKVGKHRQDWNTAIAKSTTGDFPNFEPAFQMALDALKNVDAKQKLMIVFTDGDPVFMDKSIVDKFRDAKIKVSVAHVDIHRIHQSSLLKQLVDSTGGTYLYSLASQAGVVESFFVKEVQKLRADVRPALQKIGLAFQNFHAKTGKFPGSRMIHQDRNGQEFKHPFSWRVAILPYIGEQQLFEEYRFDEAWDSENNTKLLSKMPEIYRSPHAAVDQPLGHSNMLGFATEKSGLGPNSGVPMSSFQDGTSNTILIVETAQSVPWTKPEDLTESTVRSISGQPLRYILADGSIGEMDPVDAKKLGKMITRHPVD